MGKVRPEHVKNIAHELVKLHPKKFNKDFESNKKAVLSLVEIPSTKLRNRIAGYVTRLMAIAQEEAEFEESMEEGAEKEEPASDVEEE